MTSAQNSKILSPSALVLIASPHLSTLTYLLNDHHDTLFGRGRKRKQNHYTELKCEYWYICKPCNCSTLPRIAVVEMYKNIANERKTLIQTSLSWTSAFYTTRSLVRTLSARVGTRSASMWTSLVDVSIMILESFSSIGRILRAVNRFEDFKGSHSAPMAKSKNPAQCECVDWYLVPS